MPTRRTSQSSQYRSKKKPAGAPTDWSAAQKRAEAAMRRSKAVIEAGDAFAAQRPVQRRGAPSSYRGGRIS